MTAREIALAAKKHRVNRDAASILVSLMAVSARLAAEPIAEVRWEIEDRELRPLLAAGAEWAELQNEVLAEVAALAADMRVEFDDPAVEEVLHA